MRYNRKVHDVCAYMTNQQAYKNILVKPFESEVDYDWDTDLDLSSHSISRKTAEICGTFSLQFIIILANDYDIHSGDGGVQACEVDQLNEVLPAMTEEQVDWTSECFVCNAVANAVEERLALYSVLTQADAEKLVKNSCDMMLLDAGDMGICRILTSAENGDEFAWAAQRHREAMDGKEREAMTFAEKVCYPIAGCALWIDSSKAKNIKEDRAMEAVFS